jgi:hypothetical protein
VALWKTRKLAHSLGEPILPGHGGSPFPVLLQAKEKVHKENHSFKELLEGKSLREVFTKYGVL